MKYEPTPGPWVIETQSSGFPDIELYSIVAPKGFWDEHAQKYRTCGIGGGPFDSDGDAYLISAAPDFKLVCEAVLGMIKSHQVYDKNAQQMLELVLAKANGEDVILP